MSAPARPLLDWRVLRVDEIRPMPKASLNASHVESLRASFDRLGGQLQLQPILLDQELRVIDGNHRLEAARLAGWSHIAGMVLNDTDAQRRGLIEIEANATRRKLSPLDLERAWRTYYEPEFRAQAARKRAEAPRRSSRDAVIGDSKNNASGASDPGGSGRPGDPPLSLARRAKQVTGLSIDTLEKVAFVRQLADAQGTEPEVRESALRELRNLSVAGASVEASFRRVKRAIDRSQGSDPTSRGAMLGEQAIERCLAEATRLDEQLRGPLAGPLVAAVRANACNRELLGALRTAYLDIATRVLDIESCTAADPESSRLRLARDSCRRLVQVS